MGNLDYKPSYRRNLPHLQPSAAMLFVTFRLAGSLPRSIIDEWAQQRAHLETELALIRRSDEQRGRERDFQRERFAGLEKYLDSAQSGPTWLTEPRIARLVADSMRYRDTKVYQLDAFCIMPNHVHAVFTPLPVAQAASLFHEDAAQAASLCHEDPAQAGSLCHDGVTQAASLCHEDEARAGSLCNDAVAQAASLCYGPNYHSLASIMHSLKGYTAREGNRLLHRTGAFWEHESYDHYVRNDQELQRILTYVVSNPLKAGLVSDWKAWPWSYCRAEL